LPDRTKDEVLLQRAGEGDQAAFLELYELHRLPVFRFAYRLLGSIETAEDVTHDCFLSLIRKPQNFQPGRASLRTYLFAAARNLAMKYFRSTGREDSLEELTKEPRFSSKQEPLRRVLDEELANQVRDAVMSLPALQREALVLFEYEDLSLSEIADITQSEVGTVKARLHRAREGLRRMLKPYLNVNSELNSRREIVTLREA
jgi:RNA polymerase sigma-70 factor (ECF subfamily)